MEIIENTVKTLGVITAAVTLLGTTYTLWDDVDSLFTDSSILIWSPEHFEISSGSAYDEFKAVVARQKLRDDCSVEDFKLEVRDSDYVVHTATPSVAEFSGAASDSIEKFGYMFTINNPEKVAKGSATLLGHIYYKCPEGDVLVNYPSHRNLYFKII